MSKFEQYLAEACEHCKKAAEEKKKRYAEFEKQYAEEANSKDANKKYTRRELADKYNVPESEIRTNAVKGRTDLWVFYKDGKAFTFKKA